MRARSKFAIQLDLIDGGVHISGAMDGILRNAGFSLASKTIYFGLKIRLEPFVLMGLGVIWV